MAQYTIFGKLEDIQALPGYPTMEERGKRLPEKWINTTFSLLSGQGRRDACDTYRRRPACKY